MLRCARETGAIIGYVLCCSSVLFRSKRTGDLGAPRQISGRRLFSKRAPGRRPAGLHRLHRRADCCSLLYFLDPGGGPARRRRAKKKSWPSGILYMGAMVLYLRALQSEEASGGGAAPPGCRPLFGYVPRLFRARRNPVGPTQMGRRGALIICRRGRSCRSALGRSAIIQTAAGGVDAGLWLSCCRSPR